MNLASKAKIFFHSLIWGLRNADKKMLAQVSDGNSNSTEINEQLEEEGTLAGDLLMKQETQRVKELRDVSYRIYREAEKYKVDTSHMRIITDDNGNQVFDPNSIMIETKKSNLPEEISMADGDNIILAQSNTLITEDMELALEQFLGRIPDRYIINAESAEGEYRRFKIEKYTKSIAVKTNDKLGEEQVKLECYCSIYPREYLSDSHGNIDKSDVFFLQEAEELCKDSAKKSDIVNISTIEFVTDRAYNAPNLLHYKYHIDSFIECEKYRDCYIFKFIATPIANGEDMIAKYKMEEVDKKYKTKEKKTDTFILNDLTMPEKH